MEYTVPQFIEKEPKIVGPFTFKQFVFIAVASLLVVFVYFSVKSFFLFLVLAFLILGSALALALLKLNGIPLPVVIKNFFVFLLKPKIYLWRKKEFVVKISREVKKEEPKEKETTLKVGEKSRLRELSTFLESKTK